MAAYKITCTSGSFSINLPPSIVGIVMLPTIGTRLLWRRADGAYFVVLP